MHLEQKRYLKMVRFIGIIQVYFLFEQSQGVSNEEMSNMLGQETIDACQERLHQTPVKVPGSTVSKSSKKTRQLSKFEDRASRSSGNGWFIQYPRAPQGFILQTLRKCQSFICYLHNAWWGTGVDLNTDLQSKFLC